MKILHLLASVNFGGAEKNLLNLIPYLKKRGCDIYVSFGKGGVLLDGFIKSGAKVNVISPYVLSYKNFSNLLKSIYNLYLLIKYEKIDLIHSHLNVPHFVAGILKILTKIPIITHIHGYGIFNKKEFADLKIPNFLKVSYTNVIMSRFFLPLSDKIITITKGSLKALQKRNFISKKNLCYIPNGIFIPSVNSKERYMNRSYNFVSLGRLVEQKNYSFLIEVIKDIPKEFDCKVYIAGNGPLYNHLKKMIEHYNLTNRVFLLGYVDNVYKILNKSHCFILSSIWEFFPISVLEAMSMSLPIIASDVGGMEDLIDHGENGFLCPVNNKEKFLENMIHLMKNKEKGIQMGEKSFQKVKKSFLISEIANKIFNVYNEILK